MTTPLRRDGNVLYYNQIDPPENVHLIEQTIRVYLRLSDDGTRWIVDGPTVDGAALDSAHDDLASTNSECACQRPEECAALRTIADRLPLPTASQLVGLIADALDVPRL